jgi:hypothetical protein
MGRWRDVVCSIVHAKIDSLRRCQRAAPSRSQPPVRTRRRQGHGRAPLIRGLHLSQDAPDCPCLQAKCACKITARLRFDDPSLFHAPSRSAATDYIGSSTTRRQRRSTRAGRRQHMHINTPEPSPWLTWTWRQQNPSPPWHSIRRPPTISTCTAPQLQISKRIRSTSRRVDRSSEKCRRILSRHTDSLVRNWCSCRLLAYRTGSCCCWELTAARLAR